MSRFNINLGKVVMADLVGKITNMASSTKYKSEKDNENETIVYNGPAVPEKDKLSPFDSKCKQHLVARVTQLVSDYGFDSNGEQYTMEQHEVTYIDGSTKIFEIRTSPSYVTINKVKEPEVSKK